MRRKKHWARHEDPARGSALVQEACDQTPLPQGEEQMEREASAMTPGNVQALSSTRGGRRRRAHQRIDDPCSGRRRKRRSRWSACDGGGRGRRRSRTAQMQLSHPRLIAVTLTSCRCPRGGLMRLGAPSVQGSTDQISHSSFRQRQMRKRRRK